MDDVRWLVGWLIGRAIGDMTYAVPQGNDDACCVCAATNVRVPLDKGGQMMEVATHLLRPEVYELSVGVTDFERRENEIGTAGSRRGTARSSTRARFGSPTAFHPGE